jgi:NAD+ kinase
MFKYNFIANDYEKTINATDEAQVFLSKRKEWVLDTEPEYVFVLGGDGTFLKALRTYEHKIADVKFVPFKMGGIGYYTNHNLVDDFESIITSIEKKQSKCMNYELLEISFDNEKHYAINEIKVVNEEHAIFSDIFVNDVFFEEFHGTGLAFSTSTGSTGYMKSTGGAVVYGINNEIFQMNEINPVSTNKFRTLNSPMIFTKMHEISLRSEISKESIIIDTKKYEISHGKVDIKLSDIKAKVIVSKEPTPRISLLRDMFIIDRDKLK